MRNKIILAIGLCAALASTAALAVLYPSHPGDYVYYRDDSGQVVGRAWISCYTSEAREWGVLTADAVLTHINCPPPRD